MNKSPLPKRLKEARLAAGLSQKKLGIAAGMDEFSASARMNHYETGRHTPDFIILKHISKVLKLPVAFFYAETEDMAEAIKLFHNLKKADKTAFLKQYNSEN